MTKLHGSPTPLRGDQRLQLAIPGSPISHSRLNTRSAPGTHPYCNRQLNFADQTKFNTTKSFHANDFQRENFSMVRTGFCMLLQ